MGQRYSCAISSPGFGVLTPTRRPIHKTECNYPSRLTTLDRTRWGAFFEASLSDVLIPADLLAQWRDTRSTRPSDWRRDTEIQARIDGNMHRYMHYWWVAPVNRSVSMLTTDVARPTGRLLYNWSVDGEHRQRQGQRRGDGRLWVFATDYVVGDNYRRAKMHPDAPLCLPKHVRRERAKTHISPSDPCSSSDTSGENTDFEGPFLPMSLPDGSAADINAVCVAHREAPPPFPCMACDRHTETRDIQRRRRSTRIRQETLSNLAP